LDVLGTDQSSSAKRHLTVGYPHYAEVVTDEANRKNNILFRFFLNLFNVKSYFFPDMETESSSSQQQQVIVVNNTSKNAKKRNQRQTCQWIQIHKWRWAYQYRSVYELSGD
jgi:hypothetical protein